ncbi:unnamed protein product [Prorocentrum cordatum]|uniref:Uncharacterized protein n=1 Tax=Prorocentrum cordatum TaxID=2364126 RepID=A0ABN9XYR6_9DINO|nr:unnamed protein product [Polarella glacialis]
MEPGAAGPRALRPPGGRSIAGPRRAWRQRCCEAPPSWLATAADSPRGWRAPCSWPSRRPSGMPRLVGLRLLTALAMMPCEKAMLIFPIVGYFVVYTVIGIRLFPLLVMLILGLMSATEGPSRRFARRRWRSLLGRSPPLPCCPRRLPQMLVSLEVLVPALADFSARGSRLTM